jgi:predicted AAA+ superfamily ATPase
MRRRGVNMLGGRAIGYNFFPFVYPEIKDDFDLLLIFNHGLIPSHYTSPIAKRLLQSYINDYLSSEIKAESLTRNLAAFNRFLDSITFSHGEMINYSNIARDVGISADTVKEYYNILEDTLIGYLIYPYSKKASRRIISFVPKFYLFDVGVANRLIRNTINGLQGAEAGRSLEHYIFLELYAYIHLNHLDHAIEYWRTHTGIEVDFIISDGHNPPIPVEVKISSNVHVTDMKGLKIFMSEYGVKMGYMVSMENSIRTIDIDHGKIIIYPVRDFLDHLWSGDLVK